MSDAPQVKPGDWIRIGSTNAVVCEVGSPEPEAPDIEVLCNLGRPTVYGVEWSGEVWEFAHPMRGTYAEFAPHAAQYIDKFKRGPNC
jgi:hypothetical protein